MVFAPEQFGEVWAMLGSAYPDQKIFQDPTSADRYFRQLCDLEIDDMRQAALDHIDEADWPPRVSELRRRAEGVHRQRVGARHKLASVIDAMPSPKPWYVLLQQARARVGLKPGYPLHEDRDAVRAECATRQITIDAWPEVPDAYGQHDHVAWPDETEHRPHDCPGWIVDGFAKRSNATTLEVLPCDVCSPGLRAVHEQHLFLGGWARREDAVTVFVAAELKAGREPTPMRFGSDDRAAEQMWKRIIKERAL